MIKPIKMTKFIFKFNCWYSRQNPGLQVLLIFVIASPLQYTVVLMMLILFVGLGPSILTILLSIALVLVTCSGIITVSRIKYMMYRLMLKINKRIR